MTRLEKSILSVQVQLPGQGKYFLIASQVLPARASPSRDSRRAMLRKPRSGSLPAWQCWFPAELVTVNESD